MTLGKAGVTGTTGPVDQPARSPFAANGDIFVTDGHANNRVVKFSRDGKFIKAWGKQGSGPGEFNQPHKSPSTPAGRLFVG